MQDKQNKSTYKMNTVIIYAKYPEPGKVKTRLAKSIGDERACEIYSSLLKNITLELESDNFQIIIASPDKLDEMQTLLNRSTTLQQGNNLGEKMFNTFKEQLHDHTKVLIIGSDIPDITSQIICDAFTSLDTHDIVLGPSLDGGYYLVGMKADGPNRQPTNIFKDINWSTDQVLTQTMGLCSDQGLRTHLLPELRDIDTEDDYNAYCLSKELCE